jgi:hypothetical protein
VCVCVGKKNSTVMTSKRSWDIFGTQKSSRKQISCTINRKVHCKATQNGINNGDDFMTVLIVQHCHYLRRRRRRRLLR